MTAASRRAVLMGAATLPATAALAAAPLAHPDGDLVALCDAYIKAVRAYNAEGGSVEYEEDPLWHAMDEVMQRIHALEATTMAEVVAMARVATFLAQQPDGSVSFSTSFTGVNRPGFVGGSNS